MKKEVPTVDNFTISDFAATRIGAACLAARSPWTNVAVTRENHALGLAFNGVQHQFAQQSRRWTSETARPAAPAAPVAAELLLPTSTRKPINVQMTRINAGRYGVMGPHPERERLA